MTTVLILLAVLAAVLAINHAMGGVVDEEARRPLRELLDLECATDDRDIADNLDI